MRTFDSLTEREILARELSEALGEVLHEIGPEADLAGVLRRAEQVLEAASLLGVPLDLWRAQNQLLDARARLSAGGGLDPALRGPLLALGDKLNLAPGLLGVSE